MATNRDRFLDRVRLDDDFRAHLVEDLRAAASFLTGEDPMYGHAACAEVRAQVAAKIARRLLDYAAQTCDHARVTSEGTCRYCEVRIDSPPPLPADRYESIA